MEQHGFQKCTHWVSYMDGYAIILKEKYVLLNSDIFHPQTLNGKCFKLILNGTLALLAFKSLNKFNWYTFFCVLDISTFISSAYKLTLNVKYWSSNS